MEFAYLGKHCAICLQKDFLPFYCKKCNNNYCLDHKNSDDHNCIIDLNNNYCLDHKNSDDHNCIIEQKNKKKIEKFKCSVCRKYFFSDLMCICNKCNLYTCIEHRFHDSNHIKKIEIKKIEIKKIERKKIEIKKIERKKIERKKIKEKRRGFFWCFCCVK